MNLILQLCCFYCDKKIVIHMATNSIKKLNILRLTCLTFKNLTKNTLNLFDIKKTHHQLTTESKVYFFLIEVLSFVIVFFFSCAFLFSHKNSIVYQFHSIICHVNNMR